MATNVGLAKDMEAYNNVSSGLGDKGTRSGEIPDSKEDEEVAELEEKDLTVKVRNCQIRETEDFMFTHCNQILSTPFLTEHQHLTKFD